MSKSKVVFIAQGAGFAEELKQSAPASFSVVVLRSTLARDEMMRQVEDADFLIISHNTDAGVPDEVYRAGKRVKLIQTIGMGYDWLPMPLLRELGIPVANIGGVNAIAVAEHAVTLMLMVLRRTVPAMAALRNRKWRKDLDDRQSSELYQKIVGIVGLGNIGRWAARIVTGFGARVVFYDTIKIPLSTAALVRGQQVTLEELLRTADIVTLHVPLSKHTMKLIGRRELELMKPSANLINTCRGAVVDEAALIEALQQHRIAGAGLDVFEQEPLDLKSPLLQMEQVVCTPHIGGGVRENFTRRRDQIWENLEAVQRGERPISLVSLDK